MCPTCLPHIKSNNMKKILSVTSTLLLFLSLNLYAQNKLNIPAKFPTEYGTFTFPIGSKILLELKETENSKFEYKVISIEPIAEFYSFKKDENLFSKDPKKGTVEIYFMGAYYNEGKEDKDFKTLLMLRNNLGIPINHKADIKYYFTEKFENTSIDSAFPGTKTEEIWPRKVDYITLYNFEKLKTN